MEDIVKILHLNFVESELDTSDSESDRSSKSKKFKHQLANESYSGRLKRNGAERLPTRRPDPNVYNRNALLARENRRKKKAYVEAIERELEEARNKNRFLMKALKKQYKISKRLQEEKLHFRNILLNHEVKGLVNTLNYRSSPYKGTYNSSESSTSSTYHGINCNSNHELELSNSQFDKVENDYETTTTTYVDNIWNELLEENSLGFSKSDTTSIKGFVGGDCVITDERSYVKESNIIDGINIQDTKMLMDNNGICLHIADSKMLEFCPSYHWNSSRTLPTQLLQDDCQNDLIESS